MTSDRDFFLFLRVAVPFSAIAVGGSALAISQARGHEAPTGWTYPLACCSNRDCSEIPATAISEGAGGVTILGSGEVIPYGDPRLKDSPDGLTHICRPPENPKARTICLLLPSKSF